jgi:hypothetical protein
VLLHRIVLGIKLQSQGRILFYHRHSYVCLPCQSRKKTEFAKSKIQDAYFFYKNRLKELVHLLQQLSNAEYAKPYISLSSATIGEHTRHVIEMFQCLINNYESGVVNYDERARYSAANGYQLCYCSNFKYSGFTRKGKQKNGVIM